MITRLRKANRLQLLPLVLGFALLVGVIGARSYLIESQREENAKIRAAFERQQSILNVLGRMQDAETSQRGYLLTGEDSYLEPYRAALNRIPELLAGLHRAAERTDLSSDRVDELDTAIKDKLAELADVLGLYEADQMADALSIVRSDRGKLAMDKVRATITILLGEQAAQLADRLAHAETIETRLSQASILALLGVFAVAGYGAFTARRMLNDVSAAQMQLDQTNSALHQEIDTREAAEAQVRQMQKMEAVGQLTGGIAHDFNNMLAVIISAMNLAQRKLARGESDIGKLVEAATDAASRAANLTARLLAFSRQQPLAPTVIDANRLVTGMSDIMRRSLGEAIQIETILAGGLWRTFADTSQLENALLNLAVNARDAMAEGGRLTVETANAHLDERYSAAHTEVTPGQYVMIAVTDTGTGMPPEIVAKALEPFFTTKGINKGTGLGLSQVYGFVKQSGGHLKIYSEVGDGTTVKIYLPRYFGEEAQEEVRKSPDLAKRPTETVLVVEDDARVLAGTVAALRELGYTVVHAGDGAEALVKLDAEPGIGLLFTDVVMPGMNGRKLAEVARAKRPELKVLFTTGFTKNAVVHNGVLDHGVDFIAKPFTIDMLAAKIREVLDR
jgi:signal transduction histidine kinase